MSSYLLFVFFPLILIGIFLLGLRLTDSKASKVTVELLSARNWSHSIKGIPMKFQENDGMKARIWPNGLCDLYFCESYVLILKRHQFILTFQSQPIVFGIDVPATLGGYQKILIRAKSNKVKTREFYLVFADKNFRHHKYELTLLGLSPEHLGDLERLASCVESR